MPLELTFDDFAKLAVNGKLEKAGVTLTFNRPVLSEVTIDPKGNSGKVVFFLDETDPRTNQQTAASQVWHEYVENDLETHPREGAPIEVEFQNGARAQANFKDGFLNLSNAPTEIAGGTLVKRWRYLNRP